MALTFADSYNMIVFLTKSDACEGFEKIIDFLNASVIQYALVVNSTIYVSFIKPFWSSISIKKTNDVVRLQALIDRRKVIISEHSVRQVLRLDDAKSIDCLPNEEIFAALERMGVGKGLSGVDTPLFERMLVPQQVQVNIDAARENENAVEPTSPTQPPPQELIPSVSPISTTPPPSPHQSPRGCIQTGGKIAEVDADEDVTFEEVDAKKDAEAEPAKHKEVIEVVTTAKLMTELVTTAATTITAAPSATRRRKGVVIRDPEETATPSVIVHSEPKSKDKGKGILNEVIGKVKRKEKQDNAVLRYQALKRKPQTEEHARKNMMVYLKNMAGFKMNFFKGMTYDDIRPIFEKNFNSIVAFLEKGEKKLEEEESNFGVDAIEDFKEYTPRDYYCWLKTYCCWYKLKLLDDAAHTRLRLLEESDAADEKMKILN
uniref:Xylulose kinase-1 n=1 Tax=Tanacetum cinerariifolium TaxID=118510 RepID=A0A6L2MTZ5_TANCI|nr:hypothetical protein [Tanacetum cinerariifolium]